MDKATLETINRGRNSFISFVILIVLVVSIIVGLFTNYKEETLICNKNDDICYVQKTNMINSKKRQDIIAISNIGQVSYIQKAIPGNMYAKGYTSYYLSFVSKQKEKIKIFATEYYEKEQVKKVVEDLQKKLKDDRAKIIKITRKL